MAKDHDIGQKVMLAYQHVALEMSKKKKNYECRYDKNGCLHTNYMK